MSSPSTTWQRCARERERESKAELKREEGLARERKAELKRGRPG
jgi:hypothetical protein